MNKKAKILFFCMIFVASGVFCQILPHKTALLNDRYSSKLVAQKNNRLNFNTNPGAGKNINPGALLNPVSFSVIKADYYTKNFGFFCKKELQFEKTTKVPFKFRLGSLQYCDWMEGKRSAGILPGN